MHTTSDSHGFTLLHVLLVIIVIALLCFAGWRVWQAQTTEDTNSSTSPKTQETAEDKETTTTYTPDFGGFTITYPTSWRLAQDETIGGENTTAQTLTSPSGTVLYIRADEGGKGGMCEPAPGDVPFNTTGDCSSWEYLSKETTNIKGAFTWLDGVMFEQEVAVITAHYGGDDGQKYFIGLDDNPPNYPIDLNKPTMGVFFPETSVTVFDTKGENLRYIKVYASGESADFFDSKDAQTIKAILRSLVITN